MPADAFIDPATGDLPDHNFFIDGFELALQKLRVRLGTFFGEWALDTAVGLPYDVWAQQKPPDLNAIAGVVLVEIVGGASSGILRVDNFNAVFDAREVGLKLAVQRAATCARTMCDALRETELEGAVRVTLHAGVGAGDLLLGCAGGEQGEWQLVVAGEAVEQATISFSKGG